MLPAQQRKRNVIAFAIFYPLAVTAILSMPGIAWMDFWRHNFPSLHIFPAFATLGIVFIPPVVTFKYLPWKNQDADTDWKFARIAGLGILYMLVMAIPLLIFSFTIGVLTSDGNIVYP